MVLHRQQHNRYGNVKKRCGRAYQNENPHYESTYMWDGWSKHRKVFFSWLDVNYYEVDGEQMDIDKDILQYGNKQYHPELCLIVPHSINTFFENIEVDDEVIGEGLIAMGISVNEGVTQAIQENNNLDDDLMLLELADKKRKQVKAEYEKLGLDINPLVVIQFPNGNQEWIDRVKQALDDMGYPESSGFVASWFSGDHPDKPEEITKLNGEYPFGFPTSFY